MPPTAAHCWRDPQQEGCPRQMKIQMPFSNPASGGDAAFIEDRLPYNAKSRTLSWHWERCTFLALRGKPVVAVICDLVHSRDLPAESRADAQRRLLEAARAAQLKFQDGLIAQPRVTLGDEIQALCESGGTALFFASWLLRELRPYAAAVGIGVGGITTDFDPAHVEHMDGPCFHEARAAMGETKKSSSPIRIRGHIHSRAINAALDLIEHVKSNWTDRRQEAAEALAHHRLQKDAAEELGMAPATLSKMAKSAGFESVFNLEEAIRTLANQPTTNDNTGTSDYA